jgi:hypothetical protein
VEDRVRWMIWRQGEESVSYTQTLYKPSALATCSQVNLCLGACQRSLDDAIIAGRCLDREAALFLSWGLEVN